MVSIMYPSSLLYPSLRARHVGIHSSHLAARRPHRELQQLKMLGNLHHDLHHIYKYIQRNVYIHMIICTYIYIYVYVYIYVYIYVTYVYIHIHMCICICECMYMYIYIYTYWNIYLLFCWGETEKYIYVSSGLKNIYIYIFKKQMFCFISPISRLFGRF